ncbi:hypothetical protein [Flavobacterium aquatile]|uniref:Uncharacterized protein n=1 Tax=Flavobacterium aquatile LMG 4008 = ATCC 11947 TaxID=1453498 RepID=A0A095UX44_9FLAO|nr:hypothetical protein [Flavobacterium aquatile]KGD67105.1 hypothetical protein LG45_12825 [Flavobacterium aquatile LMG 4008 = ATCC 11947]OXA66734.1 hypothetical protein B0A61_11075 [Flavobacterium aquatile LMG 4008 = ATCC 11947]GEC78400.1 hypothetical protein FAQ01_12700 [Flavobacterium aquatile]
MPIDNLGNTHFSDEQKEGIQEALAQIFALTESLAVNITAKERSKYGKVGEKGKLLIDKVKSYHESQPNLKSPEVDWVEFENDYQDRVFVSGILAQLQSLEERVLSIKILRDYDNKTNALRDYQYAKYKNRFASEVGYEGKINELKVFFPKTGKTKKKD